MNPAPPKSKWFALPATSRLWGELPLAQRNRNLALDKFVPFPLRHDDAKGLVPDSEDTSSRREAVEALCATTAFADKAAGWHRFVKTLPGLKNENLIWATLISRLVVNAAGGVLENGGLCLDRTSGIPYIPGSAVKGCARRAAIAELARSQAPLKEALLVRVALVFGWCQQDWEDRLVEGHAVSDFHGACKDFWPQVRRQAALSLLKALKREPRDPEKPWLSLGSSSGAVAFLPAYPDVDPGLEPDVLTNHHRDYYAEAKDDNGRILKPSATDDESPLPLVFPAVRPAPDARFACPVLPAKRSKPEQVADACSWLRTGLVTFGVGAKGCAGYGQFAVGAVPTPKADYELTAEFITPCFMAGAHAARAEARGASIRGQLRWWFRVLGGSRDEERNLFGGVGSKPTASRLRVAAFTECDRGDHEWFRRLQLRQNAGGYIWYFLGAANKLERWTSEGALAPGSRLRIVISFPRGVEATLRQSLEHTLEAFARFGSLGYRQTRCGGAFDSTGHQGSIDEIKAAATRLLTPAGLCWQVLTRAQGAPFHDWTDALLTAEKWLKNDLRQDYPAQTKAKPPQEPSPLPSPLGCGGNPPQKSALYFRPVKSRDGGIYLLVFEAPHERILGQKSRTTPKPILCAKQMTNRPPPKPSQSARNRYPGAGPHPRG
jgi:CRISPR type III-B/RAMP module RAMP protein Cmr6